MLKLINAMSELDAEQLLSVCRQTITNQQTDAVANVALQAERDFLSYLREIFFRICAWVIDGHYVSAVRFEPYRDGILLESLETKPSERRKGYAQALVSQSLAVLKQTGYRTVYSHIAKGNEPSIALHGKCGFKECSDTATLIDGTVSSRYCTMAYELN